MALMRRGLAAQKTAVGQKCLGNGLLDFASGEQRQESFLILLPVAGAGPMVVEHFLRRGELRQVKVFDAAQLFQKIAEILLLRESGELRDVVEPYIDDS